MEVAMRHQCTIPAGLALLAVAFASAPARAQEVVAPGETRSFSEATRCEGTPFSDGVLKATNSFCDPSEAQAEAACLMTIGAIKTDVEAFSSVITDFFVSSGSSGATVLDATVSADVEWNGVLFGASVIGGGITGKSLVESRSQDSTGLKGIDVGGTVVSGHANVSFQGKVTRGDPHSVHLKVTCKAESGLIGLDVGSIFQNNVFGLGLGDRFVRWTELAVSVETDLNERLDQIEMKIDQLDAKLSALDARLAGVEGTLDRMDVKLNEVILLLLTPQGQRSTDVLACDGESCQFPVKDKQDKQGKKDD
jgi:uncharacterized coiled-coil protein SlyX